MTEREALEALRESATRIIAAAERHPEHSVATDPLDCARAVLAALDVPDEKGPGDTYLAGVNRGLSAVRSAMARAFRSGGDPDRGD